MASVTDRRVSTFSRSPRCWEMIAWPPRARQTVFFSSAPQASTGRRAGTGSGSGDGA